MSEKVDSLFNEVKKMYDYVIVDTAPVGIVSDTLLISKYADTVVYVVRAHQLPKKMLNIALDLKNDKRLPNMAVLLKWNLRQQRIWLRIWVWIWLWIWVWIWVYRRLLC